MLSKSMLLFLCLGVFLVFTIIYLIVVSKKSTKKHSERYEKMCKELEDKPYNVGIGESLYGGKPKEVSDKGKEKENEIS